MTFPSNMFYIRLPPHGEKCGTRNPRLLSAELGNSRRMKHVPPNVHTTTLFPSPLNRSVSLRVILIPVMSVSHLAPSLRFTGFVSLCPHKFLLHCPSFCPSVYLCLPVSFSQCGKKKKVKTRTGCLSSPAADGNFPSSQIQLHQLGLCIQIPRPQPPPPT